MFRVGGLEIQVGHHASFPGLGFRIRERQIETDLLDGVKGEKPKHSVALVPGNVDNDDPILIRPEIFEEKGTMFEEVQVGLIIEPANLGNALSHCTCHYISLIFPVSIVSTFLGFLFLGIC